MYRCHCLRVPFQRHRWSAQNFLRKTSCSQLQHSFWPPFLPYLGKGEAVRNPDAPVSQNDRPAFHQRISEGTSKRPEIGNEGSAQEDVTGEIHLVVENILGSCGPTFLPSPR